MGVSLPSLSVLGLRVLASLKELGLPGQTSLDFRGATLASEHFLLTRLAATAFAVGFTTATSVSCMIDSIIFLPGTFQTITTFSTGRSTGDVAGVVQDLIIVSINATSIPCTTKVASEQLNLMNHLLSIFMARPGFSSSSHHSLLDAI